MKLNIFYRKKRGGRYSIEKVYNTLIPHFKEYNSSVIQLPYNSKGVFKRIFNIIYATLYQGSINHISGDINYVNLLMTKKKTITTIHDIYPLYRTTGWKRYLLKLFWFQLPIKKSEKIIAISEFSKSEILENFNISIKKIQVIYNCVAPIFQPHEKKFNSEEPLILHLGTKENKNLNNLLEAVKDLKMRLVIVGKLTLKQNQLLDNYNINFENVQNITDQELIGLYQKCDILSFVSTYEGFGLPIIEAQSIGRVVLTSNTASMPEVAADGALLVNPYVIHEIKYGIERLINDTNLRESLIQKGFENVKRFVPQKIANQYIKVYQNIIDAQ